MADVNPNEIHYKATLYGIVLFLTPFSDKIVPLLFQDKWPSPQTVVGCALLGIISASVGLRAYYDGSYERSKIVNGNGTPKVTPPAATPAPPAK